MPEFKTGDRVKVTTEVEVLDAQPFAQRVNAWGGTVQGYRALYDGVEVVIPASADIEKIEPPVEVFQPGDVVRHKGEGNFLYFITSDGYQRLGQNEVWPSGFPHYHKKDDPTGSEFTSEHYEKVDIG